MTDSEALYQYRIGEAEETISEAERLLAEQFSPRIIINRAYYSMFYAVLALFLKAGIRGRTSKHKGVISQFDKEFIKTGKLDKRLSAALHKIFDKRLVNDYRDFAISTSEDAREAVVEARLFLDIVRQYCNSLPAHDQTDPSAP